MKSKETLRKTIQAKRQHVDPRDVAHRSKQICRRVRQLALIKKADTLLAYLPRLDEASPRDLIAWAHKRGKTVLVPITQAHGQMEWTEYREDDILKSGPLGIPVPETLRKTTPPAEAPVIVPCLAVSPNGHRIGHGAGYYDRFLATHPGPKITIALDFQLIPPFQPDPHDIPMDAIITESTMYFLDEHLFDED